MSTLLEVTNLTKHFIVKRRNGLRQIRETVRAVDGVDFTVNKGEALGLVGESGCGKSTAGRSILRLIEPTSGMVKLNGDDLQKLSREELRAARREMSIVFQDPYSALNARMLIGDIVAEPMEAHNIGANRRERHDMAMQLLERVGLRPEFINRYPHEFSGGQRQRIGIARALASNPSLIILDEPISALDISIRAQILNLLQDLQQAHGLSYLFIAHDLSVVKHLCNRVAVMYLGVIVEEGSSDDLFEKPLHPYTQALLDSVPVIKPSLRHHRKRIDGDVPSPVDMPSGCRFRTRCLHATEICAKEKPLLIDFTSGHKVSCHHAGEIDARNKL